METIALGLSRLWTGAVDRFGAKQIGYSWRQSFWDHVSLKNLRLVLSQFLRFD